MRVMARAFATLKQDLKFQFRHGFYWVYLLVLALYVSILMNLPAGVVKETVTVFILFSDTTVLGFFFIGGLILLEKSQNILESLFVTPLKLSEYLFSKYASLTFLSVIASLIIVITAFKAQQNLAVFSLGVVLSSVSFLGIGIAIAAGARTVNDYFYKTILYTSLFFLPLLDFFGIYHSFFFYAFPTQAALILFKTAFTYVSPVEILYGILILTMTSVASCLLAANRFKQHIIMKIGAEK